MSQEPGARPSRATRRPPPRGALAPQGAAAVRPAAGFNRWDRAGKRRVKPFTVTQRMGHDAADDPQRVRLRHPIQIINAVLLIAQTPRSSSPTSAREFLQGIGPAARRSGEHRRRNIPPAYGSTTRSSTSSSAVCRRWWPRLRGRRRALAGAQSAASPQPAPSADCSGLC